MANFEQIRKEVKFRTSRSSGPGGQHVNKVESKVQVSFDISNSQALDKKEILIIQEKLKNKISKDGVLSLSVQESRMQTKNKNLALNKLIRLIQKALKPSKIRKKTNIPRSEKVKRLIAKKLKAKIKESRKKINY